METEKSYDRSYIGEAEQARYKVMMLGLGSEEIKIVCTYDWYKELIDELRKQVRFVEEGNRAVRLKISNSYITIYPPDKLMGMSIEINNFQSVEMIVTKV